MREYAWIWCLQYLVLYSFVGFSYDVQFAWKFNPFDVFVSVCFQLIHLLLLAFKESVVKVGSGWHRCFWLRIRLPPWVLQWKHARSVVSLLFGLETTIFYDFERYPLGGLMWCSQHLHFVEVLKNLQWCEVVGMQSQNSCFALDELKLCSLKRFGRIEWLGRRWNRIWFPETGAMFQVHCPLLLEEFYYTDISWVLGQPVRRSLKHAQAIKTEVLRHDKMKSCPEQNDSTILAYVVDYTCRWWRLVIFRHKVSNQTRSTYTNRPL